ncbi:MAG: ABC transporter ATP-binding protein [Candidatus Bathyarchaeota archaeon]|nr:ABC transporter ATP-binding protein [Candidatus Bathyarchaeota archaeon]
MPALEVRDVRKIFKEDKNETIALDGVNFTVNDDEFVCIVGPSGCGKSTMLRIIAGLEHATSGEVIFEGKPITQPNPKISMVFQLFGLLPWKTAQENVEVPLEVMGVPKKERSESAKAYLKMVHLDGFENTYPHDLSGGMKQRVGIARALALKPEILLMDEPFSSLDELTAKTLRDLVLAIWRKPGEPPNSLIMVSHNVEEAVYMADRVIVMSTRPGKVIGDVKIDIPRPRSGYLRDPLYFRFVDLVMEKLNLGNGKH